MVIRKERSSRKRRGSHTHGWGSKKKHRGSGSHGGHGFAGSLGHKRLMVARTSGHIGKRGFVKPQKTANVGRAINVGDLERLSAKEGVINLTELGYTKLLSRGHVTKKLKVTVVSYSPRAKEKIEKAGGSIVQ